VVRPPPNEPHQWAAAKTLRRAVDGTRNPGGSSEDFLRQSRTAIRALKREVGCFDYQVRPDWVKRAEGAVNVRLRIGYLIWGGRRASYFRFAGKLS